MSPAQALEELAQAFRALRIPFAVGGSLASSFHGIPRATLDADLLVSISEAIVPRLVANISANFYADVDDIRQSFRLGRSANLIHMPTGFKFDLFPARDDFMYAQLDHAAEGTLNVEGVGVTVPICSAEDTILAKLSWWKQCNQSDYQWRDLEGMVAMSRANLDVSYLRSWAGKMKLSEPLEKLLGGS